MFTLITRFHLATIHYSERFASIIIVLLISSFEVCCMIHMELHNLGLWILQSCTVTCLTRIVILF